MDGKIFGDLLQKMRRNYKLTRQEMANLLGISEESLSAWEYGKTKPSREQFIEMMKFLEFDLANMDQYLKLGEYGALSEEEFVYFRDKQNKRHFSDKKKAYIGNVARVDTYIEQTNPPLSTEYSSLKSELNVQIKDILSTVESLSRRIDNQDNNTLGGELSAKEEVKALKQEIAQLQATSKRIMAPVSVPDPEEMEVKLIPSTYIERIEEYRSEESNWFSWFGVFLGSIIGVFVNVVTGGQMSPEAWVLIVIFAIMTSLCFWFGRAARTRANKLKDSFLKRPEEKNL
jgi:transcriptional regulator with XRE-family HTH domain